MRSILVHAGRDSAMPARLETGLAIARAFDGHLTLLIDTPIDRFVAIDPYGGTFVASQALELAIADDDRLAEESVARLRSEEVPFDVVQFELSPLEALSCAGRLADLIVLSRDCGFAGDLALAARVPVLAVPPDKPLGVPVATACLFWDGCAEASAALRLAVPLLAGCDSVHVLTVSDRRAAEFPATDAMRYLSRHGVTAELHECPRENSVEETLLARTRELGAELIVMGAYGHSRVRELMFGGVTRFFLNEPSAPAILLAH